MGIIYIPVVVRMYNQHRRDPDIYITYRRRNLYSFLCKHCVKKCIQLRTHYINAYLEVSTGLSSIDNLEKSSDLKSKQVMALNKSIEVSNDLFKSARVDDFEVLMTQRDALESKLELIETKRAQLNAVTNVYRHLGGGWK